MAVLQHSDATQNTAFKTRQSPAFRKHRRGTERRTNGRLTAARSGEAAAEHVRAQATATPAAEEVEVKEDNEVLPTAISYVIKAYKEYDDGRKIHVPMRGLEHLFDEPATTSRRPSSTPTRQIRASDSTQQPAHARTARASQPLQRAQNLLLPSRRIALPKGVRRRAALKRSPAAPHSQGVKRSQSCVGNNASDGEDEDEDDENDFATETTKSFRMGDIEGLKIFLKHRIDELTMKPVRGMVTAWVKQLEPRRQGVHGPYHRQLPGDMPADATPPWWPSDVEYTEPAHLDKEGLLTLAVEVILQHRKSAIDQVKRDCPGGWIAKLRSNTQFAIDNTPEDQFSSSKNIVFSRLMKERAVERILPSLFDFAQRYEDYVFQYELWEYQDDEDIPLGQIMTWQFIERPPKQIAQRRRVRPFRSVRAPQGELDDDARDNVAGDTEIDEDMERQANIRHRHATARAARDHHVAVSRSPILKVSSPSPVATFAATPTPMAITIAAPTPMEIAAATPASQPDLLSSSDELTPNSSFNSSIERFQLEKDAKGGGFDVVANQELHCDLNSMTRYSTFPPPTYHPMQRSNFFEESMSAYSSYASPGYSNPSPFPFFDDSYTLSMSAGPHTPAMAPDGMDYQYAGGEMFHPAMHQMAGFAVQPSESNFNGLPCDTGGSSHLPQQPHCGTYLSRPDNVNPFTD